MPLPHTHTYRSGTAKQSNYKHHRTGVKIRYHCHTRTYIYIYIRPLTIMTRYSHFNIQKNNQPRLLASCAVYHVCDPVGSKHRLHTIDNSIWFFPCKHVSFRRQIKDWLTRSQDNVYKLGDMSTGMSVNQHFTLNNNHVP